jgi:hypothetical protein
MRGAMLLIALAACNGGGELVADAAVDGAVVDAAIDAAVDAPPPLDAPMPSWAVTWTCESGCTAAHPRPMVTRNLGLAFLAEDSGPCSPGEQCAFFYGCVGCAVWVPSDVSGECATGRCGSTTIDGMDFTGTGVDGTSTLCRRPNGTIDGTFTCTDGQMSTTWTFTAVAE